jgi:protein-tyrosine-phosphatase
MAAALLKMKAPKLTVASAGTKVDVPGQSLTSYARNNVGHCFTPEVMDHRGIDVRPMTRTLITEDLARQYDLVISMAEEETTPSWLTRVPGYQHWDVRDPGGRSLADTETACEEIDQRIDGLLSSMMSSR